MKKLAVALVLASVLLLSGCVADLAEIGGWRFNATVSITSATVTSLGDIRVDYTITNTGEITIDYYKVYLKGYCTDDTMISDYDNGIDLLPQTTQSDYTYLLTGDKTVTKVAITKIVIKNYNENLYREIETNVATTVSY
jgi:hypothetical protein